MEVIPRARGFHRISSVACLSRNGAVSVIRQIIKGRSGSVARPGSGVEPPCKSEGATSDRYPPSPPAVRPWKSRVCYGTALSGIFTDQAPRISPLEYPIAWS